MKSISRYEFFESLEQAARPKESIWDNKKEMFAIYEYAMEYFKWELSSLSWGTLYVLPLTVSGEIERERLDKEDVFMYGCSEEYFKYNGETYIAILVNND